jgi:hypothetical protein
LVFNRGYGSRSSQAETALSDLKEVRTQSEEVKQNTALQARIQAEMQAAAPF